jgi:hypothetical protein
MYTLTVERLQQIQLFERLDSETLALLARRFHYARYQVNEMIFEQGDVGKAFYILQAGTLRVRRIDARGEEHAVGYYTAPYHFGETSLLTGAPHDVTVDVFSDIAEMFVLTRQEWENFLQQYPDVPKKLNVRTDVKKKLAKRFRWLGEGEYVIVHTRRHWFALVLMLRLPLLITLGLALVAGLLLVLGTLVTAIAALGMILWLVTGGWLLLATLWTVIDWSNDYLIITNRRVVHYERVLGLFEERTEAPIEQVSNVNESSLGIASRVFNYSDVRIETAGHQVDIYFPYVPRRHQVRQNIFGELEHVREYAQREKRDQLRMHIRNRLLEYIAPSQIGIAPPAPLTPKPSAPPRFAARQRRASRLGTRLNAWFGIQIEEKGRIRWRKHWFDLLARTGKWLGATLLVAFIGPLIFFMFMTGASFDLVHLVLLAVWIIALTILGLTTWWHYEDWRNDIYELTDDSVLDIERAPFRLKERSVATTLERIQNISYSKPRWWNNLFDYGDLIIETAGGEGRLIFRQVTHPQWAAQEIFRRREALRNRRQQEQTQRRLDDFLDWVLVYHQILQQQGDVRVLSARAASPPQSTTASSAETPATASKE